MNNYRSAFEATKKLVDRGCKRMGIICYDINLNALTERQNGCVEALKQAGRYDPALVKIVDYNKQDEEIHRAIADLHNLPKPERYIFVQTTGRRCAMKLFSNGRYPVMRLQYLIYH